MRAEEGEVEAAATRARVAAAAEELRAAGASLVVTYDEASRGFSEDGDSTVLLLALGRMGRETSTRWSRWSSNSIEGYRRRSPAS